MKSEYYREDDIGYVWWGELITVYITTPNGGYTYNAQYFHRIDGPAITFDDGTNFYYIFNMHVSEQDFNTPGFVDSYILEHS